MKPLMSLAEVKKYVREGWTFTACRYTVKAKWFISEIDMKKAVNGGETGETFFAGTEGIRQEQMRDLYNLLESTLGIAVAQVENWDRTLVSVRFGGLDNTNKTNWRQVNYRDWRNAGDQGACIKRTIIQPKGFGTKKELNTYEIRV